MPGRLQRCQRFRNFVGLASGESIQNQSRKKSTQKFGVEQGILNQRTAKQKIYSSIRNKRRQARGVGGNQGQTNDFHKESICDDGIALKTHGPRLHHDGKHLEQ
jgi:hypothetical protein